MPNMVVRGLAIGVGIVLWDWVIPSQGGTPLGLGLVPFLGPNHEWDYTLVGLSQLNLGLHGLVQNFLLSPCDIQITIGFR